MSKPAATEQSRSNTQPVVLGVGAPCPANPDLASRLQHCTPEDPRIMTMISTTDSTMTTAHDAKFWDGVARKYAAGSIRDLDAFENTLSRVGELLKPDDHVLELGCGTGTAALRIAPAVASYLATDISPEMIAIAREKADSQPVPQLHFEATTADALAERGDRYDAVLGFNYIHLVDDLERTLTLIRAMVKPGGYFITKTPCVGQMNPLIRLAIPILQFIGKAPSRVHPVNATQLAHLMEKAGFKIIATEYHGTKGKDVRPFFVAQNT
ncbi:MAG: class I SAM-dependent methyltransferase [Anderseniella sp.]|nr:class I SAM-dependent methyltransferase [Anderseniella sp.]